ncbi:hypothetical protein AU15_05105 [Marinobacter salarius]|uniref:Uncharacterized protein n=1 Tax=Marinobacter salarius TaxID=1420917 RepID=W5YV80_9GAMM|nr:hypothetical protein AU15_05105 [Marinobacter salarius]
MMSYAYLSVLYPENREIRDYAEKVCRWWTQNVPDDGVAYWDFDAPQEADTPKDTSATSIACYALLTLATVLDDRQAARYINARLETPSKPSVVTMSRSCRGARQKRPLVPSRPQC